MTANEFETGVNNILDNTPKRGVSGSQGVTKYIFKLILAQFKLLFAQVIEAYENGIRWRGVWSSATAYAVLDTVTLNGSTYRCKLAHTNQAVTNTTYWDIVAAKGDSGDQIQNFGGSLLKNGALELGTLEGWPAHFTVNPEKIGGLNTGSTNVANRDTLGLNFFRINNERLTKIDVNVKNTAPGYIGMWGFDTSGNVVTRSNGGVGIFQSSLPVTADFTKRTYYVGGVGTISSNFGENAVQAKLMLNTASSGVITINKLIVTQVQLSEAVPSNLPWIPDGQAVFDSANQLRKGTYINSTVGTVWHTQQEITLQPNGTSISFNIRRTYKFTWAVVYNDAVTIVSQPSGTVNANTDALLVLTGTAGKSITISIQQIQ